MALESPEARGWPAPLAGRVAVDGSAGQVADAIVAVWREIDLALHPIIGHRGVAALFNRSLALAAANHPWLAQGRQGALTTLDASALKATLVRQSAAAAAAGGIALFQSFRELLASLIGASLTDRLLRSVWALPPDASPVQDILS